MLGALIGGALSFLGGERANDSRQGVAADQMAFQERMSNTSYQRAMADMRAAGLNPMLAYSQGGASVPAGAMPQIENSLATAGQVFSAIQSSSSAAQQADTQSMIGDVTVQKIKQETANLSSTNDQIVAVTQNLGVEYQNLIKQGYNLTEVGNQIRATVEKIYSEIPLVRTQEFLAKAQAALAGAQTQKVGVDAALGGLDLSAAESMDNAGRMAGQVAPVLKILVDVLRQRPRGD